jgi:hypothetical protein
MASATDLDVANFLSQADDTTKLVLNRVASESAVSGWALAKMLNKSPDEVETVLSELQRKQLLSAQGEGLDGMYYLTQLGYLSQSLVKS